MYLHLGEPIDYKAPWQIDLTTRLSWLTKNDIHVAYFYEQEDTSTFRYRVFNMIEALNSDKNCPVSATWFTRFDLQAKLSQIDPADILVICRTRYDHNVARLVEYARSRKVPVIFDVDDLVVEPDLVHLIIHTMNIVTPEEHVWDYWYAYTGRLRATMQLCDGVITSTPFLAEQIGHIQPQLPSAVIPNYLNRVQTDISDYVVALKEAHKYARDGLITIGYFSGSPSHNADLLVASPALAEVMRAYPNVRLRIIGFADSNNYLQPYAERIDLIPLQDYLNLQRLTAECEFSIAPLRLNLFTMCKSELKYFEPAIAGCPVIASPSAAFNAAIQDGKTGFLAEEHEWAEKLETLVQASQRQSDTYMELVSRIRSDSRSRYGWRTQSANILRAFATVGALGK